MHVRAIPATRIVHARISTHSGPRSGLDCLLHPETLYAMAPMATTDAARRGPRRPRAIRSCAGAAPGSPHAVLAWPGGLNIGAWCAISRAPHPPGSTSAGLPCVHTCGCSRAADPDRLRDPILIPIGHRMVPVGAGPSSRAVKAAAGANRRLPAQIGGCPPNCGMRKRMPSYRNRGRGEGRKGKGGARPRLLYSVLICAGIPPFAAKRWCCGQRAHSVADVARTRI